jgi:hypothetical protein
MHISDKSGVILRFWDEIERSKFFKKENCLESHNNEAEDRYYQRALETIILNYADKNPSKELFKRLKMDGVFTIEDEDETYVDITYQCEYIPYRLDLANHSPMGFSMGGGSSSSQLALAVLAKASDNKTALRYYEDFKPFLLEAFNKWGKRLVTYRFNNGLLDEKGKIWKTS